MLYTQSFGAGVVPEIYGTRSSPTDFSGSVPVSEAVTAAAAGVPLIVETVPHYAVPAIVPPAPPGTLTSPTAGICPTCQGAPMTTPVAPGFTPVPAPAPEKAPAPAPATSTTLSLKDIPLWVWLALAGLALYKAGQ